MAYITENTDKSLNDGFRYDFMRNNNLLLFSCNRIYCINSKGFSKE